MLPTFAFASRRVGEMLPSSHSCAVDFTNNRTATSPMCRVPKGRSGLSLPLVLLPPDSKEQAKRRLCLGGFSAALPGKGARRRDHEWDGTGL